MTDVDLFFSQVKYTDDCWEWQGFKTHGYGLFCIDKKRIRAHRWSYEYFVGPIENGLWICHHCDNRPCVNPFHIYAGTPSDNARDVIDRGRHYLSLRTHCPQGHEYNKKNTRVSKDGRRTCIACYKARKKKFVKRFYKQNKKMLLFNAAFMRYGQRNGFI